MSANQPTAAWSGPGDPLIVVAGHLVSPQDNFGEIGRMPNGNLRRFNRLEIGTGGALIGGNLVVSGALSVNELESDFVFASSDNTGALGRNIDDDDRRFQTARIGSGGIRTLNQIVITQISGEPNLTVRRANGTEAIPTAVLNGQRIARYIVGGFDGAGFVSAGGINSLARENWAVGARGTSMEFQTVPIGSTVETPRWEMQAAGHLVAATDNVVDIGASGANRPRDLFLARDLTMPGGNALIGSITPATGGPRLDVVGENSFDTPTIVGAQRIDDLADKWFAIAVRHDAIAEEPFIMIAGLSSGISSTVMYGGGTAPVAGSVNAATRHEWYTAADSTTIRGTLSASLSGVGATSLFHALGNLRIGALSGTNVSVGTNDSGGAGFKLLRVPN